MLTTIQWLKRFAKKREDYDDNFDDYKKRIKESQKNSFEIGVSTLIEKFEEELFDITDNTKTVAEILFEKSSYMITNDILSCVSLKENDGFIFSISKSKKFVKWKSSLEKRFGIKISFDRCYQNLGYVRVCIGVISIIKLESV